jgi:hypothetical protein
MYADFVTLVEVGLCSLRRIWGEKMQGKSLLMSEKVVYKLLLTVVKNMMHSWAAKQLNFQGLGLFDSHQKNVVFFSAASGSSNHGIIDSSSISSVILVCSAISRKLFNAQSLSDVYD